MHFTGMTRTLYLAVNKDTDELYSERIKYNKEEAQALVDRAERIIKAQSPPERIANRKDWYECQWCCAVDMCWGCSDAMPIPFISCRQCCHATPIMDGDGQWKCEKYNVKFLNRTPCPDHLILPGLISFAQPINSNENWIEFTNDKDGKFCAIGKPYGKQGCVFTTKELMQLLVTDLFNPAIHAVKDLFNAEITVSSTKNILSYYPEDTIVWQGKFTNLPNEWKRRWNEDVMQLIPITKYEEFDYKAMEFSNKRLIVQWIDNKPERVFDIEIRQPIPF